MFVEKKNSTSFSIDEVLIRIFLRKLGYDEKTIDKVCEAIW